MPVMKIKTILVNMSQEDQHLGFVPPCGVVLKPGRLHLFDGHLETMLVATDSLCCLERQIGRAHV